MTFFTACEITNMYVGGNLLFKLLRDNIYFMYSKDRSNSQLLCSRSVTKEDLDEKLDSNDVVNACAKLLREEVQNYHFHLEDGYSATSDLITSHSAYKGRQNLPWEKSFHSMFP